MAVSKNIKRESSPQTTPFQANDLKNSRHSKNKRGNQAIEEIQKLSFKGIDRLYLNRPGKFLVSLNAKIMAKQQKSYALSLLKAFQKTKKQ